MGDNHRRATRGDNDFDLNPTTNRLGHGHEGGRDSERKRSTPDPDARGDVKRPKNESCADHQGLMEELQTLRKKNAELESKVAASGVEVMNLEKINKNLYDESKRREVKQEVTEQEMLKYNNHIRQNFDLLKHMAGGMERVKIFVEPDPTGECSFVLQDFLDDLFDEQNQKRMRSERLFERTKDFQMCRDMFFGDMLSPEEVKQRKELKRSTPAFNISGALISEWCVTFMKKEVYGKSKGARKQLKGDTAIDLGGPGPSWQFLTDAFLQMQALAVPVLDKKVALFQRGHESVDIIPRHDDALRMEIQLMYNKVVPKDSTEIDIQVEGAMDRIKLYSRAMGRMLLHAFFCGYPVPSSVMTPFFMNLLLRGVMPGDFRYPQKDVLKHMDGILLNNADRVLSYYLDCDEERDKNGQRWTRDTIFSELIPDYFIKTRSVVLGGLMDGLSLWGKRDLSEKLQEGRDLTTILCRVPLEALSNILFARPTLTFEDVKDSLRLDFSGGSGDWEYDPYLENYKEEQEEYFKSLFISYIKEEAEKDNKFLSKFVECCTGSSRLPFVNAGGEPFLINVVFNMNVDGLSYPTFHTCTRELVLPGDIFKVQIGESFREMMNEVISGCVKRFDMN